MINKPKDLDQALESLFKPIWLLDNIPIVLEIGMANSVKHENGHHVGAEEACKMEKEHP